MVNLNKKNIVGFLIILIGFLLLTFHLNFLLVIFAGVFLAVILNYFSNLISEKFKIKYKFSFPIALVSFFVINTLTFLVIGSSIDEQVYDLIEIYPKAIENLKEQLSKSNIGLQILNEIPSDLSNLIRNNKETTFQVLNSFYSSINTLSNLIIILFIGIYLAFNPSLYSKGLVQLFPVINRELIEIVLGKVHNSLSSWMLAKLSSMLVVGILSFIGLEVLGIHYPYALALIAALCSFIPYLGPYIALIPALLVASLLGVDKVIFLIITYVIIQTIEGYLITPYMEKKLVSLPPALTLVWMLLMGLISGLLGLILATPILAMLIVLVKELYIKDYLEKETK